MINTNKKKTILFIFLLISFSLFLVTFMESDYDYFWHIKTGEYIFNNGIIKKDIFSCSVTGKHWISH